MWPCVVATSKVHLWYVRGTYLPFCWAMVANSSEQQAQTLALCSSAWLATITQCFVQVVFAKCLSLAASTCDNIRPATVQERFYLRRSFEKPLEARGLSCFSDLSYTSVNEQLLVFRLRNASVLQWLWTHFKKYRAPAWTRVSDWPVLANETFSWASPRANSGCNNVKPGLEAWRLMPPTHFPAMTRAKS